MTRSSFFVLFVAVGACAKQASPSLQTEKPVRLASANAPMTCSEAVARAKAKPDLDVDRIPAPLAMKPAPLQKVPATAWRKDGSAEVKVDVVIDTLGRADMKTFKVVSVSHPWFATNVKSVIGKWTFSPAELAGCKVPRIYHFMASAPPRARRK